MYDRSLLTFMSRWLHAKAHMDYVVFGVAEVTTNGYESQTMVVYWGHGARALYVRDIDEFLDGRFLPLDYSPGKEDV